MCNSQRYKFLLSPLYFIFIFCVSTAISHADVLLEDIRANNRFSTTQLFSNGTVSTGSGNAESGDYVLFTCVTEDPNNTNSFLPPAPGSWTEVDTEKCFGPSSCISGIWGGFVGTPNAFDVTCSWEPTTSFVFAAGSFRYEGVDGENPIIAFSCFSSTTETGSTVNFPQVVTEAGSQVVYILNRSNFTAPGGVPTIITTFDFPSVGDGVFFADAFNTFTNVATQGETRFHDTGGLTEPFTIDISGDTVEYRACTIALRMGTPPLNISAVPTLSEWGLIAMASLIGIAGFMVIRRRKVTS